MENGVCKVCGIVVAVYNMDVNKSGDKTYYKQKFSISFEDKKNNKRYANLELKNQKINEFGKIIEQSYIGNTEITCWVDISDYRASSWASCNCFKIRKETNCKTKRMSNHTMITLPSLPSKRAAKMVLPKVQTMAVYLFDLRR